MPLVSTTNVNITITANSQQALQAFNALNQRLTHSRAALEKYELQFRRLDRLWTLIAVGSGAALVKSFVMMAAELQKTQLQIATFTRNLDEVPAIMDSVINLTERVPFSLNSMTQAFVKLKAAGLNPIVDASGNGPLKDLTDAVAAFGGNEEIFQRATIAIQQMAGKGVISMEELRQQLGEAVPNAIRIMAEQMGISTAKLISEVSKGNIEFQRGIDALFKGFREKFGGAGELLKTTFTGQLQQTRLEFEKLSKVILLDSGVLDVLTSVIKVFNGELDKLGKFLKSPEGTEAIRDFNERILNLADDADRAIDFVSRLATVVFKFVGIVADAIGQLPPEVQAGGLIGFILFRGKAGLGIGALAGLIDTFFNELPASIRGFIDNIINGIPDELKAAGIIGFLFFGKIGKIGALAVLIASTLGKISAGLSAYIMTVLQLFGSKRGILFELFFGDGDFTKRVTDAFGEFEKVLSANYAKYRKIQEENAQFLKDIFLGEETTPETTTVSQLEDSYKELGTKAGTGFVSNLAAAVKRNLPLIEDARDRIVKSMEKINDIGGLTTAQEKAFEKITKFMAQLRLQLEGTEGPVTKFRKSVAVQLESLDKIINEVSASIETLGENDSKVAGLRKELETLLATRAELVEMADKIAERMGAWGKLMDNVADSLESGIADGLLAVVNRTKSAKEVLLDFYNSITQAVVKYLANQAMVGIFGKEEGFGSSIGSFVGSIGNMIGGLFMAGAGNQSMIVGGSGGTDSQTLVAKVSPGEQVQFTAPGMGRGSGGGDHYHISISALDGQSVREILMKEGATIVGAMRHRQRLNRAG